MSFLPNGFMDPQQAQQASKLLAPDESRNFMAPDPASRLLKQVVSSIGSTAVRQAKLAEKNIGTGGSKKSYAKLRNANNIDFDVGSKDWRVKISLAKNAKYLYNDSNNQLLSVLSAATGTDGVIFPYTPDIQMTHNARYGTQNLTHSNYTNYFYEGSDVQAISITGDFTVQNLAEGEYVLACIYFFRAATKMFFGAGGDSGNVGNPPPMVFLNGYGDHYFPNVPCVVTSFSHKMPNDVDYVDIPVNGKMTRVPSNSQITVTLQPIYTRKNLADNFNLAEFAKGNLLAGNGGFI